jgi:hypothetical protein
LHESWSQSAAACVGRQPISVLEPTNSTVGFVSENRP